MLDDLLNLETQWCLETQFVPREEVQQQHDQSLFISFLSYFQYIIRSH